MMQPDSRSAASEWIATADGDLHAARLLLAADPPLPGIVMYHAQQGAEKALKAFLIRHNTPFRRTHDLVEITTLCTTLDPSFSELVEAVTTLNPGAVSYRYPDVGAPRSPSSASTNAAVQLADQVLAFVKARL